MLEDVVAAVAAAPVWAQCFMAFFALMFLVMTIEPRWIQHRVSARFAALAGHRARP